MSTGHGSHFGIGTGKALAISAWLTGIYFVIELGIGIYTRVRTHKMIPSAAIL